MSLTVKQHDLLPPLVVTLTDEDASGATIPVDLTAATSIVVNCWRSNVVLFARRTVAVPVGAEATAGRVTMPWQTADTAVWADLYLEVEVTWSGKPQTYPPDGFLVVHVEPDLG